MTCNECIHETVCYRLDIVNYDYAEKCGDYLPQKSGKWLITHLSHMAYCSECDFLFKDIPTSMVEHFKYCPNCGKRMDDPQESEDTE